MADDKDTIPDGWTLSRVGNLCLDLNQKLDRLHRAVVERLDDLQLRCSALERGMKLVPLHEHNPDGDNGTGGA